MTSNLLLSAFDIPLSSIYINPPDGTTVDEDLNQYNLMSRNRYSLFQFGAAGTTKKMLYDLGSANATKSANHLIIARADILKNAGTTRITLRGGSEFSTPSLTNMFAWWDATTGVTKDGSNRVSAWADQSGNSRTLSQGTGGNQPLWVSEAINGYDAIDFDGANYFMGRGGAGPTQPYTIFCAIKGDSTAGTQCIVDANTAAIAKVTITSSNYTLNAGTQLSGSAASTSTNIVIGVFNGASSTIYVNSGSSGTTGNAGANNMSGFTVGCTQSASNFFDGKIGEIIAYSGALSAADILSTYNYLDTKWRTAYALRDSSFASATLVGPRSNDYVAEFTASSAARWWQLEYYGTSQKFCHSKASFGSWLDLGNPSTYTIDRVPGKEAKFFTDSGVEYMNRVSEEIYRLTFTWKHLSYTTSQDVIAKLAKFAHRASFFLYTTAAGSKHTLLDNQRLLHVRIVSNSIKMEQATNNYVNLEISFEEILG